MSFQRETPPPKEEREKSGSFPTNKIEKVLQVLLEISTRAILIRANFSMKEVDKFIQEFYPKIKEEFLKFNENEGNIEDIENQISNLINQFLEENNFQGDKEEMANRLTKEIIGIIKEYWIILKKGNFADLIEDSQEIRAWLYLILPEGKREIFRNDFQKAVTAGEPFYFRFWPPSIIESIIKRGQPIGYEPSEFLKDIEEYIEDIYQGKDRITLFFRKDKLPEELRQLEDELETLGIHKTNDEYYEIYITPEKILDIIEALIGQYLNVEFLKTEVGNKFKEIEELLKKQRKNIESLENGQSLYKSLISIFDRLVLTYNKLKEEGASEDDLKKIEAEINQFLKIIKDIETYFDGSDKKDQSQNKEKAKIRQEIVDRIKEFLKNSAYFLASSFSVWALLLGWYLPLWFIVKMDDQISKSIK